MEAYYDVSSGNGGSFGAEDVYKRQALARALENYAIIGDHDEGTLKSKGDKALLRACLLYTSPLA